MAIDGFFIRNLIIEVRDSVLNNRLERITMPKEDIVSFSFYYNKNRIFLNFKLKPSMASFFLTNEALSKESENSNFLLQLKRNLEGYILTDIKQKDYDRVVLFEFSGTDLIYGRIKKVLVLELMGRYNNLILLNNDGLVIDAYIKNLSHTNRSILNNVKYEYFNINKKSLSLKDIQNSENEFSLSKDFIGVSPILSKYLYKTKINIFEEKIKPTKLVNEKEFYWFDLFNDDEDKLHYDTLSELLISKILQTSSSNIKYKNFIEQNLNTLNKKIINLKNDLAKATHNLNYKDFGNYIYSSQIPLNEKHSELISYDKTLVLLDVNKTLLENAQGYFKHYSKAKRAIDHLEKQIDQTNNLITTFNQFNYDLNNIKDDFNDLESELILFGFKQKSKKIKKVTPKPSFLTLSYLNNFYYVGKNSKANDYITHTLGSKNDYWFHIEKMPGSHVIMKGELNDETLKFGALLAGFYSKDSLSTTITINYTQIKYLKKIPGLPGSQVSLSKYQTIILKQDFNLINEVIKANKLK